MQPLVEHRLELDGFATRALELEGDGPPLVLLHGFADSADCWRLVLDRLARRDRRAIAVDLPGFATAARLAPTGTVLDQLDGVVDAAIALMREESGGAAPVVVGNSLGGCLALRAAERHGPDRLAGAVPVSPAGFDHPLWFRAIEAQPLLRTLLQAPVPVPSAAVRLVVGEVYRQLAFARPRAVPGEVVASFTYHHRTRALLGRHLANGRRLLPEIGGGRCFDLAAVRVPLLLVWGARDRMVSPAGARHVLEAVPGTRFLRYDEIGHCPQVEAPDRLVADVLQFAADPAAAHVALRA
jgi:pimeloyl-ACP methyl ester carboxylesterase